MDASSVSDVVVVLGDGFTPSASYRSVSMSGTIRHALMMELKRKKKLDPTAAVLEFTVTDCRLRTGSQVFWWGVAAGGDHVAGTVTIRLGDQILKTFDASAKGIDSAWSGMALWRLSAGRRADRFARMIARDVVDQI